MTRIGLLLMCGMVLAACDATNPITGGPDADPEPNPIPAELAGSLLALGYDGDNKLTLVMQLDNGEVSANYTRQPGLDIDGYKAFTTQDDPLDRMYTALVAESFDGGVTAGVVADGGQFNRFFGGGFYKSNGGNIPTTGLVSYGGTYAGVTNTAGAGGQLLDPPPGTDPDLLPRQSDRVEGTAFLNVDFADGKVNGAVTDRRLVDDGDALETIVFIASDIAADGSFTGSVEFLDQSTVGTYGGVFGGDNASAVGGVVHLTEFSDAFVNEEEYGVFVLTRCGLPGDADVCDGVGG